MSINMAILALYSRVPGASHRGIGIPVFRKASRLRYMTPMRVVWRN